MTSALKKSSLIKKKNFQIDLRFSCSLDLTLYTKHTQTFPGGISYLGSHDAEAHAFVLLQGYCDNLRIFPHWLKREIDRKDKL